MSPLRWLLCPPIHQALQRRYRDYRRLGVSGPTACLQCLWIALAWTVCRLETPAWQRIIAKRRQLFPHIASQRPRPLDALRYLLQLS